MKNIIKSIETSRLINHRTIKYSNGHRALLKLLYFVTIHACIIVSTEAQVTETLYLSDPSQSLDRNDPVSTGDNSNSVTGQLHPHIYGSIADSITSISYSGDNSSGPLGWTSDWIETELNPPAGAPIGPSGGYVLVGEFPVGSGQYDIGIIDRNVGDNIMRSFDLTGIDSADVVISIGTNYGNPNNSDIWRLSVSSNGGSSYTTLIDFNKNSENNTYTLPLSTFTSNMVIKLELISKGGSQGTGIVFEDISINYKIPESGSVSFDMGIPFCEDFTISSGQNINIISYANIVQGTVPASPNFDAILQYGSGPATIIDLSGTSPTWNGSFFTWSGTIPSNVIIPSGEAISLNVINNDNAFICSLNYDSQTYPSRIELPTTSFINIDALDVFDNAYNGGTITSEEIIGSVVYVRSTVSNPFGAYDIEAYDFNIIDPNGDMESYTAVEVATSGCTKTYEFAWTIPLIGGDYTILGNADEGIAGVSVNDTITFSALVPVSVNKTLISPISGPYTIDDILVYNLEVQNGTAFSISTLPLQDIFDESCLEYITASVSADNVANGSILWNNLGSLPAFGSTNLNVTFRVIGNCEPARNIAKIEDAIFNSNYATPAVFDTLDLPIDQPPLALDDLYHISSSTNLPILNNDTDPDNDMTSLSIISPPSSGLATVNGLTIDFNPSGMSEDETVNFTYRICDNANTVAYCAEANVTVVYSALNNPPSLTNDQVTTSLNLAVLADVLTNDSDIDGDLDFTTLSISVEPQFGTANVNPDGTITYLPNNEYFGLDQLTYMICDNGSPLPSECSTAILDLSIAFVHYACKSSSATINVSAVSGADSYVWDLPVGAVILSGDGTNEVVVDFSAVSAENFNICVEPSNFCGPGTQQCVEVVLTDLNISSNVTDATCLGENNGMIDVIITGGVRPYVYNWSNGTSIEDLNNVGVGNYSLTVTDQYGCTATISESIAQPPTSVSITGASIVDENPYGANNGSIDITISGGSPGYSFQWTDESGNIISTSEDPVGLSRGTYRVVVTDSNGCSDTNAYTINSIGGPLTIIALITTDVDCYGGTTGVIDLEVTGGSGSYTYDWDNDGTNDFDDPQDLSNLSAGIYTVIVDDGLNPQVTSSVEVFEPLAALSMNAIPMDLTCYNGNNGSIDVSVSGGSAPYSFNWSSGAETEDISELSIGNYSVSVTDANGCIASTSATLIEPGEIEISGLVTDDVCGLTNNGSIDLSVVGGTGSYSFNWSHGAASEDVSGLSDGFYSVVVMDDSGCANSATFTIKKTCVGLSKEVIGIPINNGDGSYFLIYQISIENYGNVALDSIQVIENLSTTFTEAIDFTLEGTSITSQPSQPWILNPNYDGNTMDGDITDPTDDALLGDIGNLLVGEKAIFQIQITVIPGSELMYNNSAIGNGISIFGEPVSDISQDGDNPDPDNDGDPTNNNDPTPVILTENPIIGLAKRLGPTVTNNHDGTYSLSFELKVENVGDVLLTDIQIVDDLQLTFPGLNISGVGLSIVEQPVYTTLTINSGYTGLTSGDINLLDGTDSLVVGEFAILKIDLTVEINGSLGIFYNTSAVSGISPAGNNVNDISQDGIEVDPDNDGDPTNNNDPTPVSFLENPVVNVIKKLDGEPITNVDGTYTINYNIQVTNEGDVPLLNLQLIDDLNAAFPGLTITDVSTNIVSQPSTTTLTSNTGYDGLAAGDINLLEAGGRLNVGELAVLDVILKVALDGTLGPFTNWTTASGNGPGGTPAQDSDSEELVLTESPSLGVAKTVDSPVNNQNGTYSINYSILVENTGDVPLKDLQIEDDLSLTFGNALFTVTNISSPTLSINGSYIGVTGSDIELLEGTDTLGVGATADIILSLTITPGSKLGIYYNSAIGTAFGKGGTGVTDISQNGTDVDPDNDGDPTNNNDPTPVSFIENPIIGLAKDVVTSIIDNMDGSFSFTYEIRVENMGDVPLYNVQVVDDLAATFALADGFSAVAYSITQQPATSTWNKSNSFNGSTEINLLSGTETLNVGDVAIIQIKMMVTPGEFGGPYWNSAIGFGSSPAGRTVLDYSQDGLDVDPDNDGIPTNNNDPTPVIFFFPNNTYAFDDYNQTLIDIPVGGDLSTNDIDPQNDNQEVYNIAYDSNNDGTYNTNSSFPSGNTTSQISGFDEDGNFVLDAGSITVYDNGLYNYFPSLGFTGTAYMLYEIVDDNLNPKTDNALLVIDVINKNINDLYPPIAQDDNATTAPDINVDIQILINDSDVDGYLITSSIDLNLSIPGIQSTYSVVDEGIYVVNHMTGIVTFDPTPTFLGTTTPIDYQVCDNDDLCDEATITVVINDDDIANIMTAEDDANSGYSGDTLIGNILINDIDPDGSDGIPSVFSAHVDSDGEGLVNDALTLNTSTTIYGESKNIPGMFIRAGLLTIENNGDYIYISNPLFEGTVQSPYRVCDNNSLNACANATLYLTTVRRNSTVAEDDYNQTLIDITVYGDVSTNDWDPEGDNQTVTSSLADTDGDGQVDDILNINLATTIYGINEAGDTVSAGLLGLDSNGLYYFDPNDTFIGTIKINYTATDDNGQPASDDAILVIDVTGPTTGNLYPPIALDDNATTEPDVNVEIPALDNDHDVDGVIDPSTLDLNPTIAGIQPNFTVLGEGTFTIITSPTTMEQVVLFDPEPLFIGTTTPIDYSICDNDGLCDEAKITVVISDPTLNDMTAEDDANIGDCNGITLVGNVLSNDIDPDGSTGVPDVFGAYTDSNGNGLVNDPLVLGTSTIVYGEDYMNPGSYVEAGLFTLNSNGTYTYVSDINFKGTIYIPYTACDNDINNACDNATLYLTMARENPTSEVTGDTILCLGETTTLFPNTSGTWVSSDTSVATVSNSGIVQGLEAGTVTFRYTDASTGCLYDASEVVLVNSELSASTDIIGSPCIESGSKLIGVPSGGTSLYSYNWNGPNGFNSSTDTVDIFEDGTYNLTITDALGCTAIDSAFLIEAFSPQVLTTDSEICEGEEITLTVNSPSAVSYQWSTNAGDSTTHSVLVTPQLPSENYFVTVTNNLGCTAEASIHIVVNAIALVSVNGLDEICIGDTTSIIPNIGGIWTSSDTTIASVNNYGMVTGVSTGIVVFTFLDTNTVCISNPTEPITIKPQPNISVIGPDIICEGQTTSLTPVSGGTWTSNNPALATIDNNGEVIALDNGIVNFVYTDSLFGCPSEASTDVTINIVHETLISGPSTICLGDETYLSPNSGGVWMSNDSTVAIVSDAGVVSSISPGTTTFTFTSDHSCVSNATSPLTIVPLDSIIISGDSELCEDDILTLVASRPNGTWSSSNPAVASVNSSGEVEGIAPGLATIIYTHDPSECQDNPTFEVTILEKPTISMSGPSILCPGEVSSVSTSATGGIWLSSDESVAIVSNDGTIVGVSDGTATFSYLNPNTCLSESTIPVTVTPNVELNIDYLGQVCLDNNSQLFANVSGGVPEYSYSWSGPEGFVSDQDTIDVLINGLYNVLVTDSIGCTSNKTAIVYEAYESFIFSLNTEICEGEEVLLSVAGPEVESYLWSPNADSDTLSSVTVSPSVPSDTYHVTITNTLGCTTTASTTINVQSLPQINITGDNEICEGGTTNFIPDSGGIWTSNNYAVASISNAGLVTGFAPGTVNFTFRDITTGCLSEPSTSVSVIENQDIFINGNIDICMGIPHSVTASLNGGIWSSTNTAVASIDTNGVITPISAGITDIIFTPVTDSCYNAATLSITVHDIPTVNVNGPTTICSGEITYLSPSNGGIWVSNNPTVAMVSNNGVVTGLMGGNASFTYTSDAGCQHVLPTPITVIPSPDVSLIGPSSICVGEETTLSPSTGGVWISSNNNVASVNNMGIVSANSAGIAEFVFIEFTNGCIATDVIQVTVIEIPTINGLMDSEICVNETTSISPNFGGNWISSDPTVATISSEGIITGVNEGVVTFAYINNVTGCSSQDSEPLMVNALPNIMTNGPTAFCVGESSSILADNDGTWSSSDVSVATITNEGLIMFVSAGNATFTFTTNESGCASNPSEIFTVSNPTGASISGPSNICIGEIDTLITSESGTWSSNNESVIEVNQFGVITASSSGIATITLNTAAECVENPTIDVLVDIAPNPEFSGSSSICVGSMTTLLPNSGGVWISSDSTIASVDNSGIVTALSSGTVDFIFTDNVSGCSATISESLNIYDPPLITIVGSDTICVGENTNIFPSSGGVWNSSDNMIAIIDPSGEVTGISAGIVTFTFSDTSSYCSSEVSDAITILPKPEVSITGVSNLCVGMTTNLSPSSGGSWVSTNISVATVSNEGIVAAVGPGIAKFTFISDSGCSSNQTAPLIVFDLPAITIDGSSNLCLGDNLQLLPASGGIWMSSDISVATVDSFGEVTSISHGVANFMFTDTASGCTSIASDTVTINANPVTDLNGLDSICIGGTTNFTPAVGGVWTSLNPDIASIENNGEVTGNSVGSTRFLFMDLVDGCISDTSEFISIINEVDPVFSGPEVICVNDTSTILPNAGGTWISSNPSIATISDEGVIVAINQGIAKFKFTNSQTGCSSGFSSDLIVNGLPPTIITGSSTICIGSNTELSPDEGGIWLSVNPTIATTTNGGIVTGLTSGVASFIFQDTITGCISDNEISITVEENVPISVTSDSEICIGYKSTLLPSSGGYWISHNPDIASVTNNGIITGRAPGKVTFEFVETSSGCENSAVTNEVTIRSCLSPDFNVAVVNESITGNLNTNDNTGFSPSYSTPILISKPLGSIPSIIINTNGSYTFQSLTEGKYLYSIPVCKPDDNFSCPSSLFEVNVVDNIYSTANPVSNLEFATIFSVMDDTTNAAKIIGEEIFINALANDKCGFTGGCDLDTSSLVLINSPSNGTASSNLDGEIVYTPNMNFIGIDTLEYQVCAEGGIKCSNSTQIITVNHNSAANTIVAVDDFGYTLKSQNLVGNVLQNDSDPEGDTMSIVAAGSSIMPIEILGGEYFIDDEGNYTFIPEENFIGYTDIIYTICDDNVESVCRKATLHILVFDYISLNIRMYLEGALMQNGNETSITSGLPLMRADLRNCPFTGENYIPMDDPYTVAADQFIDTPSKFNRIGPGLLEENIFITDSLAIMSEEGDNAIVDWVHIELRSKYDMTLPIATRSGLLQRDGDVVDLDGTSTLKFQGVHVDSFYIVAKHRSHLGVMSMKVSNEDYIDFTDTNFPTFDFGTTKGNGVDYSGLAQKSTLINGYNVLWAGDFDSNGKVKFTNPYDDQNVMFIDVLFNSPSYLINYDNAYGYLTGDYNMNGKTKYTNPSDDLNYLFSQVLLYPNNTSFLSNYNSMIEQIPE